jgi:hypothetical protein
MERYSRIELDGLAAKWGRLATLLGPPSMGFGLRDPHDQRLTVVTLVRHYVDLPLVTLEKLKISCLVPKIK